MNKYPHPCKHCGAHARIEVHKKGKTKSARPLYKIRCTCCGLSTRYYAVKEYAVAAWNRSVGDFLPDGLRNVIEHNERD